MTGPTAERGVVTRGTGGVWLVRIASGETREASLRGRLKQDTEAAVKLAIGDEVVIVPAERGSGWMIDEILPRRSKLARRAPGGKQAERVLAANVDQVVIVFAAARPEPNPRMLDRFLVIAEANELPARIVLNKVDLVAAEDARARFADQARAGYAVHLTSVKQNVGLDPLRDALRDRVSVFTGPSGVGKSSLLNAIHPGLALRVGEISDAVQKGRHTTVGGSLHPLPGGGYVVDTPGLREVGVWDVPSEALDQCFPELRALAAQCRFADCTHTVEPDCAVRAAVDEGRVSRERYESYVKLLEEISSG